MGPDGFRVPTEPGGASTPGLDPPTPGSARTRIEQNFAALRVLADVESSGELATPDQLQALARWTSWGAVPQLFDPLRPEFADERDQLRETLTQAEYRAAERTTINAHYTHPAYAEAMWAFLERAGIGPGHTVLEPGVGAGVFAQTAPAGAQMVGVELDPTTARIAQARFPHMRVLAESFADTQITEASVDAVIGNVPFADVSLHDPRHNAGRHSIHNHFLIKSLALTRPGGYVVALTSRYTLDAVNPSARNEMFERADLVSAIRLPTGAHRAVAGTDAVTDLLVLRRRHEHETAGDTTWLETTTVQASEDHEATINAYLAENPQQILGRLEVGHGMYGRETLNVTGPTQSLGPNLASVLAQVPAQPVAPATTTPAEPPAAPGSPLTQAPTVEPQNTNVEGRISYDPSTGGFTTITAGRAEPLAVPKTQRAELRALLTLRDSMQQLTTAEATPDAADQHVESLRTALSTRYQRYLATYGPINRVKISTNAGTDKYGDPIIRRTHPGALRKFSQDPHAMHVRALENFDETSQTATPAAILSQRVITARQAPTSADTPEDALAISLNERGRIDVPFVAGLLRVTDDHARAQLRELTFTDPATDSLVTAEEYLSGNVRAKLAQAEQALDDDPSLQRNVEALREVIPTDLGPEEIDARLGAPWIPDSDVTAFLQTTLSDPSARAEHVGGSNWATTGNKHTSHATVRWGTERMDAITIVQNVLTQKQVLVHDTIRRPDGSESRVLNPEATAAALDKAGALGERFSEWVWEDPERAGRLTQTYNDTFNAIRLRDYSTSHLTLPGLSSHLDPMPHQYRAVARMVADPAVGLFHEVGAGKTASMVMGVMELRRLGMVQKPAIVVPNHMLEQFSREFLQLYPRANLLAASTGDLAGDARRLFVARVATGNWDAVILTRGAFQRMPVSEHAENNYRETRLEELRTQLERAREVGSRSLTFKGLQRAVQRGEQHLQQNLPAPATPPPPSNRPGSTTCASMSCTTTRTCPSPATFKGSPPQAPTCEPPTWT